MNLFNSKSKYSLGMTKEPSVNEPIDLKALYEKVKKKKEKENKK